MKFSFTKAQLLALPLPAVGQRVVYHDTRVPGLQLRVTSAGSKTFSVYRRTKAGQPERVTLGKFPAMTIEQARQQAAQVNAEISSGASPAVVRRSLKAEPTFAEAVELFISNKRKRNGAPIGEKTAKDYRDVLRLHMADLTARKLSAIDRADVVAMRDRINRKSPSQADKAVALTSAVYAYMLGADKYQGTNPASLVKKNPPVERDRFLQPGELPRFFDALTSVPSPAMRDLFLLSLLTGARRSNVLAMRWDDVDLESGLWRIERTKNGTPQNVTLSPEAVELLHNRRASADTASPFVFPGTGVTGHLVEPKGAWKRLLDAAGIENLRIHDLRRTLGSWQARQGTSLPIIGKSLNHKTQQATAIYARLDLAPVRESVNGATAAMLKAAGVK